MIRMRKTAVGRELERLLREGVRCHRGDAQLLERYLDDRDESAFETLVERHGPMVSSVCRRYLRDPRDVEDAFQATFLVLIRRGSSLRDKTSLSSWLYGVAYRVAWRARSDVLKRRGRERESEVDGLRQAAAPPVAPFDDSLEALDAEMSRLPEKYRAPLILCYLEGRTHDQAAAELGWPVGTVRSRMAKARATLEVRLTRRGLDASACLTALRPEFLASSLSSSIPPSLVRAGLGAGGAASLSSTSTTWPATALAQGVLTAMMISQWKWIGVATAALGFVTASAGMGVWAVRASGGPEEPTKSIEKAQAAEPKEKGSITKAAPSSGSRDEDARTQSTGVRTPTPPEVQARLAEMERKIDRLTELLQRLEQRPAGSTAFPPDSSNLPAPATQPAVEAISTPAPTALTAPPPIPLRPLQPPTPIPSNTPLALPSVPAVGEAAPAPFLPQSQPGDPSPSMPLLPLSPGPTPAGAPTSNPFEPETAPAPSLTLPHSNPKQADAVMQYVLSDHNAGGVREIQAQLVNLAERYKRNKALRERASISAEECLVPVELARILVARLQQMDDDLQQEWSTADAKIDEASRSLRELQERVDQAKSTLNEASDKPPAPPRTDEAQAAEVPLMNARDLLRVSDSSIDSLRKKHEELRREGALLKAKRERIKRTLAWADSHFDDLRQDEIP